MVSVLDILSECEIEPFSGSIRNVVGERGNGGGPEAERKLWVLPRGERENQRRDKIGLDGYKEKGTTMEIRRKKSDYHEGSI